MKIKLTPSSRTSWAHHPPCSVFRDHVYEIKGYLICRGCFNFYLGITIGIILFAIIIPLLHMSVWTLFFIILLTFLPTPIVIFIEPFRIVKDIVRLILGISSAASLVLVIYTPILVITKIIKWELLFIPLLTLICFFVFLKLFSSIRYKRNLEICLNCPLEKCELDLNKDLS